MKNDENKVANLPPSYHVLKGNPGFYAMRLRAPEGFHQVIHAHYDNYKHESSGTLAQLDSELNGAQLNEASL